MDQEPLPYYSEPGALPAPPPPPVRRVPRVAITVGLTAFLALAGAGLALAASGGSTSPGGPLYASSGSDSTASTVPWGPHVKMRMPGMRFGFGGIGGPVIHAEYTVQDGSTYKTYATQVGEVTSVSGSSITVKSADGFTQTYVVEASTIVDSQSSGISAVASKDTVRIEALVSGSSQTATNIVDVTKIGASRKGFGLPDKPGGGWIGYGPGGPDGPPAVGAVPSVPPVPA